MSKLAIYNGRQGATGSDGIGGIDQSTISSPILSTPLISALHPNKVSKTTFLLWDRDSQNTYVDTYGVNKFTEVSSYSNHALYSNDFTQWGDSGERWTRIGATADPFGGTDATEISLDVTNSGVTIPDPVLEMTASEMVANSYITVSFYIRLISGTITSLDVVLDNSVLHQVNIPIGTWERRTIKVHTSLVSSLFSINPRGTAGAIIGVYGVQLSHGGVFDLLTTTGAVVSSVVESNELIARNKLGYLINGTKENLIHYSNDLSDWSVTGGTVEPYTPVDAFGDTNSVIRILFGSLSLVTVSTTTQPLIEGQEYTVSFMAYTLGGSITSLSGSLGNGVRVIFSNPSVSGFTRISAKIIAGASNTFNLSVNSPALTAKLLIQSVQIEAGELTSYKESGNIGATRDLDLAKVVYRGNVPKPSSPWTICFRKNGLANDARKKTIFSNGRTGTNEFSAYFINKNLILNNGGNTVQFDMFDAEKIAIVYDGTTVKYYKEQREVFSSLMGSTSYIGFRFYLGSNGTDSAFDAYLSKVIIYDSALSNNNIAYLLGA